MYYLLVILVFANHLDPSLCEMLLGAVRPMPWRGWTYTLLNKCLTNMTYELLKDAHIKVAIGNTIRGPYEGQLGMLLGMVCANIQDMYAKLLVLYRKYAFLYKFQNRMGEIWEFLNNFHMAQSLYNKIRVEQLVFYQLIKKKEQELRVIKKIRNVIAQNSKRKQMSGPDDLAMSQMANRKTRRNMQEPDAKKVPPDPIKTNTPDLTKKYKLKIEPTDFDVGPLNINKKPDSMEIEDLRLKLQENYHDLNFRVERDIKVNDDSLKNELRIKAENHVRRIEEVIKNTYKNKMIPTELSLTLSDLNKEFDEKNEYLYDFKRGEKLNFVAEKKAALDRFKYVYDEELPVIDPSKHPLKNSRRNTNNNFRGLPMEITEPTTKKRKWKRGDSKIKN